MKSLKFSGNISQMGPELFLVGRNADGRHACLGFKFDAMEITPRSVTSLG